MNEPVKVIKLEKQPFFNLNPDMAITWCNYGVEEISSSRRWDIGPFILNI